MRTSVLALLPALGLSAAVALPAFGADRVKTANGMIESTVPPKDGVRSFKGIPFAQPPVGDLRWREPQPVKNWPDVRNADRFGAACMQRLSPNADYWLRSDGMSEDCLYLNVWTPAKSGREKLPVLVATSSAADSRTATAPSRGMTARAWPARASSRCR